MNFEALPCMLKAADGTPLYGLLVRPMPRGVQGPAAPQSPRRRGPTPILPRGGEPPSTLDPPLFIPAAAVHGFREARRALFLDQHERFPAEPELTGCAIPSDPYSHDHTHPAVERHDGGHFQQLDGSTDDRTRPAPSTVHSQTGLCGGDLADLLRDIDSQDISCFLRDVSVEAREPARPSQTETAAGSSCSFAIDRYASFVGAPPPCAYQSYSNPFEGASDAVSPFFNSPATSADQSAHQAFHFSEPPSTSNEPPSRRSDARRFLMSPTDPEQLQTPGPSRQRADAVAEALSLPELAAPFRDQPGSGTPDSGIQSIGESPREPPPYSPRRGVPSPAVVGFRGPRPILDSSPSPARSVPPRRHSPRVSEPLSVSTCGGCCFEGVSDCDASPLPLTDTKLRDQILMQSFGDMPHLERQGAVSILGGESSAADAPGSDPSALIDKILSSLPPEKLVSFSKMFEAKLEAAKLRERENTAAENFSSRKKQLEETSRSESVIENDKAAKKLAEYRHKMKRKRDEETATHQLNVLCRRMRDLGGTGAPNVSRPVNHLRGVDWALIDFRNRSSSGSQRDKQPADLTLSGSKQFGTEDVEKPKPTASPAVDRSSQNLEQEASEDGSDLESPACPVDSETRSSLKVRIRLLRAKTERLSLTCADQHPDDSGSASPSLKFSGTATESGSSLPPKKRFKRSEPLVQPREESHQLSPIVANVEKKDAVAQPPRLTAMMSSRRRKRLPYPWDRKRKKRAAEEERRSEGGHPDLAGPPRLFIQTTAESEVAAHSSFPALSPQISPTLVRTRPTFIISPNSGCKRRRLNPGLLRRCSRCGLWLKVDVEASAPSEGGDLFAEGKDSAATRCEGCARRSAALAARRAKTLTTGPPRKKFAKCGRYFDPATTTSINSYQTSLWSPSRCLDRPGCVTEFKLPYDLWWQFVHQKEFECINPSANYKRISRNTYADAKVARAPNSQPCGCLTHEKDERDTCGEGCLNRLMYTECTPSLCPCGDRCSNRRFQKRQWASGLEKFSTGLGKGLGLRCTTPIQAGSFVCEYVGEVVTVEEFAERTRSWYGRCRHHYALKVDAGAVIDAYRCGGLARFINHSCEPNCEVQKWVVNGRYRMGVFAIQDIPPGQELTYNYNFRPFSRSQRCLCSSPKCTGTVGGRSSKTARRDFSELSQLENQDSDEVGPSLRVSKRPGDIIQPFLPRLLRKLREKRLCRANCEFAGEDSCAKVLFVRKKRQRVTQSSVKYILSEMVEQILLKLKSLKGNPDVTSRRIETMRTFDFSNVDFDCSCIKKALIEAEDVLRPHFAYRRGAFLLLKILSSHGSAPRYTLDSSDDSPVGSYDPDEDRGVWTPKADQTFPAIDKVRCVCGIFEEDGTMIQCDDCLYWMHADCVGGPAGDPNSHFSCDFCRNSGNKGVETVFRDVLLSPQPEFRLPRCIYYRALLRGRLQIRIGECVYLKKEADERQKRILREFNRLCVHCDEEGEESVGSETKFEQEFQGYAPEEVEEAPSERSQLRIMRVERLFIGPAGERFVFGSYFAYPHETFCEPSRRFYTNEVFVTPLYDTRPLEAVVGRCLVLDPGTYRRGRPSYPRYLEADVYVCEFRVDKGQRLFDKSSVKTRYPLNTNPHIFRKFDERLRISRDFAPFSSNKSSSIVRKVAVKYTPSQASDIQTLRNLDNLEISDSVELKKSWKWIRLEHMIEKVSNSTNKSTET